MPSVLGFLLTGSRGKGFATEQSDYDCAVIVTDDAYTAFSERMCDLPAVIDASVFTLGSFDRHAAWGSELAWDRYNWAHLRALVDKTGGKIQGIIDEKGRIPGAEVRSYISGQLDHYINQVYRSIKCLRDGNAAGYRLEAADSILPLMNLLFAVHDGRLRPYYKYLEWELDESPLTQFPWSGVELLEMIGAILADGSYLDQQAIFIKVEAALSATGYLNVLESWGDKLWFRDYDHEPDDLSQDATGRNGSTARRCYEVQDNSLFWKGDKEQ